MVSEICSFSAAHKSARCRTIKVSSDKCVAACWSVLLVSEMLASEICIRYLAVQTKGNEGRNIHQLEYENGNPTKDSSLRISCSRQKSRKLCITLFMTHNSQIKLIGPLGGFSWYMLCFRAFAIFTQPRLTCTCEAGAYFTLIEKKIDSKSVFT